MWRLWLTVILSVVVEIWFLYKEINLTWISWSHNSVFYNLIDVLGAAIVMGCLICIAVVFYPILIVNRPNLKDKERDKDE